MAIPKVIHRVWIGGDVPAEFDKPWRTWADRFPDYELRTWLEADLAELGMPPQFHTALTYAGRSDIARLEILNRLGGIYTDCDATPMRRFDHLWTDEDRAVWFEYLPGRVWNGCIVAAPGGLSFVRDFVLWNAPRGGTQPPDVATGPRAIDAALAYQANIDARGVRSYPPAFLSTEGSDPAGYGHLAPAHPDAVLHTVFAWPAHWAFAPKDPAATGRNVWRDLTFRARLLPVRVRRSLRRS